MLFPVLLLIDQCVLVLLRVNEYLKSNWLITVKRSRDKLINREKTDFYCFTSQQTKIVLDCELKNYLMKSLWRFSTIFWPFIESLLISNFINNANNKFQVFTDPPTFINPNINQLNSQLISLLLIIVTTEYLKTDWIFYLFINKFN